MNQKIKRWLSAMLAAALVVCLLPGIGGDAKATAPSGNWTDDTYYDSTLYTSAVGNWEIADAADLAAFAKKVNDGNDFSGKTVTLTADIDLSAHLWVPIGKSAEKAFKGVFDGAGYEITNMVITNSTDTCLGLFGYVLSNSAGQGVVENVSVKGELQSESSSFLRMGLVVGNNKGIIRNCSASGTINGKCTGNTDNTNLGGITGYNIGKDNSGGKVINCFAFCTITGESTQSARSTNIGGIIGYSDSYGEIKNCYTAKLTIANNASNTNNRFSDGIVGYYNGTDGSKVTNCYSSYEVKPRKQGCSQYTKCFQLDDAQIKGMPGETNDSWKEIGDDPGDKKVALVNVLNEWVETANATAPGTYRTWAIYLDRNDGYPMFGTQSTELTIGKIPDQIFADAEIEPALVIKDGATKLVEGVDYTVEYENNINVGTAKVTITFLGEYVGVEERTFNIIPAEVIVSGISVENKNCDGEAAVYTGTPVSMLNGKEYNCAGYEYTWYNAITGEALEEAPVQVGSYYLEIAANDSNVYGSQKVEFVIAPQIIDSSDGENDGDTGSGNDGESDGNTFTFDETLSFRSNADFTDFIQVVVTNEDGYEKLLEKGKEYTIERGSIIINLLPEYLSTLAPGQYTVDIVSGLFESKEIERTIENAKILFEATSVFSIGEPLYPAVYTITSSEKITASADRSLGGKIITLKVTPGYVPKVITFRGAPIPVNMAMNGTYWFTMPFTSVTVTATASNPFADVFSDDYSFDATLWAVDKKITTGKTAKNFAPFDITTRAEMVTFLWRAAGSPIATGTNPFTDVAADAYYYNAVLWGVKNGIVKGTSATTFSPDVTVTRAQAVTFLARLAGVKDEATGYSHSFTDVAANAYYANAVAWAAKNGIANGKTATAFAPNDDCTRGMVVTFLWRYFVK